MLLQLKKSVAISILAMIASSDQRAWYVAAFEVGRADDDDDAVDERADDDAEAEDDGGSVTSAISASSARNSRSSALTYGRGSVGDAVDDDDDDDCGADAVPLAGDTEDGDKAVAEGKVDAVGLFALSFSSTARSKCSLAHASPASAAYASTY